MLTEKYRPKSFDEMLGHKKIIKVHRGFVEKGDMPNLLYIGKPGTGKTAMAYALKNELGLRTKDRFMELNASDERKIETIRTKVKGFARTATLSMSTGLKFKKMMLLDEIDGMTKISQRALRRIMEVNHKVIRFVLTANVMSAVSQALVSRCALFRFRGLHPSHMMTLLQRVCKGENQSISNFVLDAIIKVVHGDARLGINLLEPIFSLEKPTKEDVYELAGLVEDDNIYQLVHRAVQGRADDTLSTFHNLLKSGASATEMLRIIFYSAMKGSMRGISANQRLRILHHIGAMPGMTDDHRLAGLLATLVMDVKIRR